MILRDNYMDIQREAKPIERGKHEATCGNEMIDVIYRKRKHSRYRKRKQMENLEKRKKRNCQARKRKEQGRASIDGNGVQSRTQRAPSRAGRSICRCKYRTVELCACMHAMSCTGHVCTGHVCTVQYSACCNLHVQACLDCGFISGWSFHPFRFLVTVQSCRGPWLGFGGAIEAFAASQQAPHWFAERRRRLARLAVDHVENQGSNPHRTRRFLHQMQKSETTVT